MGAIDPLSDSDLQTEKEKDKKNDSSLRRKVATGEPQPTLLLARTLPTIHWMAKG